MARVGSKGPLGQTSWVGVQSKGALAVPAKRIETHLKAVLRKSRYSDERQREFESTPDEVRRHPDFVRGLLIEDWSYPEWVDAKGDGPALRSVLEDPAFVAGQDAALVRLIPFLPARMRDEPEIVTRLAEKIAGYASHYASLPEAWQLIPAVALAAAEARISTLATAPLEKLDPATLDRIEALALERTAQGRFEEVPDALRQRDGFVEAAARRHPNVWDTATEDERARITPLYAEPEVRAAATAHFAGRLDSAYSKAQTVWRSFPEPLRAHPEFLKACLLVRTEVAKWAKLEPEEVGALLDPELVAAQPDWRTFDLVPLVDDETATRPDVVDKLCGVLREGMNRGVSDLPEVLRTHPVVLEAIIEAQPKAGAAHVPLDNIPAQTRDRLLDAFVASCAERGLSWDDVPERLQGSLDLARRVAKAMPETLLPPELAAEVEDLFADPDRREAAVEAHLKRYHDAYYRDEREAVWAEVPNYLRKDPTFLRGALVQTPKTLEYADEQESAQLKDILRDSAFLTAEDTPILRLADRLEPDVLARQEIVEALVAGLDKRPEGLVEHPVLADIPACLEAALGQYPSYVTRFELPPRGTARHEVMRRGWVEHIADRGSWADAPPELRGDPEFVRAAVRERPKLFSELSGGELEDARPLLEDDAFFAEISDEIEHLLEHLPEARMTAPAVVDAAQRRLEAGHDPWVYRRFPEPMKRAPALIQTALEQHPSLLLDVPFDAIPPELDGLAEEAAKKILHGRVWDWEKLPEGLKAKPGFVQSMLRELPHLRDQLSDEERATAQPVFDDPSFLADNSRSLLSLLPFMSPERQRSDEVREAVRAYVAESPDSYCDLPAPFDTDAQAILSYVKYQGGVREDVPREALTEAVLERLVDEDPRLLSGVGRDEIPDPLYDRAEARLRERISDRTTIGDLPEAFRDSLPLRRALLDANGLRALYVWGHDHSLDPALWIDAKPEQLVQFAKNNPTRLDILPPVARANPEVASAALLKASAEALEPTLAHIPADLWSDAAFVDALMAEDPSWFRQASPELRADPARAKLAIQAHPKHLTDANLSQEVLRAVVGSIEMPVTSYGSGGWANEEALRSIRQGYTEHPDLSYAPFAEWVIGKVPSLAAKLPMEVAEDLEVLGRTVDRTPDVLPHWPFDAMAPDAREQAFTRVRARTKEDPTLYRHLPRALRDEPGLLADIVDDRPRAILEAGRAARTDANWRRAVAKDATVAPEAGGALTQESLPMLVAQLESRAVAPAAIHKKQYLASDAVPAAAVRGWGGHAIHMFEQWFGRPEFDRAVRDVLTKDADRAVDGLPKLSAGFLRLLLSVPEPAAQRFSLRLIDLRPSIADRLPAPILRDPVVQAALHENAPRPEDVVALPDEDARIRAVRRNPAAAVALPPHLLTPAVAIAAVESKGELLGELPAALRDDFEVVKAAVANHGDALSSASERLRADPMIVEAAIRARPEAIRLSRVPETEARPLELLAVREGGLIDGRVHRLSEADFVLAFAEYCETANYKGKVDLSEQVYRFEHLLDDDGFVDALVDTRPSLLAALPEGCRTPERLFRAALRSDSFWQSGFREDKTGALRKLPVNQWPALAKAYPRRFVSAFAGKEALRDLEGPVRDGVLLAVGRDHTALDKIPRAWWSDGRFIADAVDENPLAYDHFGPARKLWLRTIAPETVARAERFLDRVEQANITASRFDGQGDVLRAVITNRFDARPDDARPVAAVVFPKDDHNGAFDRMKLGELAESYRLMYYEADTVEALGRALQDATEAAPAEVVVLSGHGSPDSLNFGGDHARPDVNTKLRPEHLGRLAEMVPPERIADDAKVIFDACSVGGGGAHQRNLAVRMEDVWPHVFVQAAWFQSSSGNRLRFGEDGKLERMDFRNASTLRPVPFVMVRPRKKSGRPKKA